MTNIFDMLQQIPWFAVLGEDARRLLAAHFHKRSFVRGDIIVAQGQPGSTLHLIAQGQVRVYTLSATGQEVSMAILRDGDFFGELSLLDGQPRSANVVAMCPTTTMMIERAVFLSVLHANPSVAVAILEALAARLRQSTLQSDQLVTSSAMQRVVSWLVELGLRYGECEGTSLRVNLRLTQDDLASLSGTTRETVNRVLALLRQQELVDIQRTKVRILNLPQLQLLLQE